MNREFYEIASYIEPQQKTKLQAMMSAGQESPWATSSLSTPLIDRNVAVVPIRGIITSESTGSEYFDKFYAIASSIIPQIQSAASNPNIKTILLMMDTPGGSCKACDSISYSVQQAAQGKNVEVFADGMLCSAGVHIAAYAHKITATPQTLVGSVGVISTYYDTSSLFEQAGYKAVVLTTGIMKAMGVPGAEITDEQKNNRMALIQDLFDQFKSVLMEHRGLSKQQVDAVAEKGDVWLADKAKAKGLIDMVSRWDTFTTTLESPSVPVSRTESTTPNKKENSNMTLKEKKAAILASCKGINEQSDAAFILSALESEKEVSEVAAEWREQMHNREKDALRAELEAMKAKEKEREDATKGTSPGISPVSTNAKEEPTGNVREQFLSAIARIQEREYKTTGNAISKAKASRILAAESPKVLEAYTEYCEREPQDVSSSIENGYVDIRS